MKGPPRQHPTPPRDRLYLRPETLALRLSLFSQDFGRYGAEFPRLKRIGTQGTF